ncbi:MAG TPA: hypothetical protein VL307_13555 [Chitinophagaceae bacterium]|nr:hypothetical protein [Chitinophagaceae bacterium]
MKKQTFSIVLSLLLLVAASLFVSFTQVRGGTVGGNVNPPEGGLRAFLFSGKDTLSVNVSSGNFQFTKVPSGTYKLLVEAAPPYGNAVKEGIRVLEGEFTDAGQIELRR